MDNDEPRLLWGFKSALNRILLRISLLSVDISKYATYFFQIGLDLLKYLYPCLAYVVPITLHSLIKVPPVIIAPHGLFFKINKRTPPDINIPS